MLIERAYKTFCARHLAKAIVLLGVSVIALIVSAVMSHMRTDAGAEMVAHVAIMATAVILMVVGLAFLRKARLYSRKAAEYAEVYKSLGN